MASFNDSYDSPNYTLIRQAVMGTEGIAAAGIQNALTFRSRVAAVVTGVGVVLTSVSSVTLILTLLVNGSVAAILTLSNSANEVAREFTLTANRTLTSLLDRMEISTNKDKGEVSVVYEYRIVPGATFSLNAALS